MSQIVDSKLASS